MRAEGVIQLLGEFGSATNAWAQFKLDLRWPMRNVPVTKRDGGSEGSKGAVDIPLILSQRCLIHGRGDSMSTRGQEQDQRSAAGAQQEFIPQPLLTLAWTRIL